MNSNDLILHRLSIKRTKQKVNDMFKNEQKLFFKQLEKKNEMGRSPTMNERNEKKQRRPSCCLF